MLRVLVDGPPAVAAALAGLGHVPVDDPTEPVALVVRCGRPGDADVVLGGDDAGAAVARLHAERLAPWTAALASGRPDVTAAPHLLDHDPGWSAVAARRCTALREAFTALGRVPRRVDHIGSTAVPGLVVKPYLDLQVTVDVLPGADDLAAALLPLGWAPAVGARPDSPGVHRDLLRADAGLRHSYEDTKAAAARAHAGDADYDDYTRDKTAWLVEAYREVDRRTADAPWPDG